MVKIKIKRGSKNRSDESKNRSDESKNRSDESKNRPSDDEKVVEPTPTYNVDELQPPEETEKIPPKNQMVDNRDGDLCCARVWDGMSHSCYCSMRVKHIITINGTNFGFCNKHASPHKCQSHKYKQQIKYDCWAYKGFAKFELGFSYDEPVLKCPCVHQYEYLGYFGEKDYPPWYKGMKFQGNKPGKGPTSRPLALTTLTPKKVKTGEDFETYIKELMEIPPDKFHPKLIPNMCMEKGGIEILFAYYGSNKKAYHTLSKILHPDKFNQKFSKHISCLDDTNKGLVKEKIENAFKFIEHLFNADKKWKPDEDWQN